MDTIEKPNKVPLKRFDIVLRKFIDVAIPLHLDFLNKHQENIAKFQKLKQWNKLHHEQVNASRTVQQLKADIREIDKVRQQVLDEDIELFDQKIIPVKLKALKAVQEFIDCHKVVIDPTKLLFQNSEKNNSDLSDTENDVENLSTHHLRDNKKNDTLGGSKPNSPTQTQCVITSPAANSSAVASWHYLHDNLIELNHLIRDFHEQVHKQQEAIDEVEENVEDAAINIHEGTKHLTKATKLKTAMFPLAGAVIGCVAGGPVGLLAGFKIGLAATVGGGLIGYQSGKFLKRRNAEVTDIEMSIISNQNAKGSLSLQDLSTNSKWD